MIALGWKQKLDQFIETKVPDISIVILGIAFCILLMDLNYQYVKYSELKLPLKEPQFHYLEKVSSWKSSLDKAVFQANSAFDALDAGKQYAAMYDLAANDRRYYPTSTSNRLYYKMVELHTPLGAYRLNVIERILTKPDGSTYTSKDYIPYMKDKQLKNRIASKRPLYGDSPEIIRQMFGEPAQISSFGRKTTWTYTEGFKLAFIDNQFDWTRSEDLYILGLKPEFFLIKEPRFR